MVHGDKPTNLLVTPNLRIPVYPKSIKVHVLMYTTLALSEMSEYATKNNSKNGQEKDWKKKSNYCVLTAKRQNMLKTQLAVSLTN
jgi:hypothetical protein